MQRPRPLYPDQEMREIVLHEVVSVVLGGLVPGFLLGLLAFKVKSRWCPRCGEHTHTMPPAGGGR